MYHCRFRQLLGASILLGLTSTFASTGLTAQAAPQLSLVQDIVIPGASYPLELRPRYAVDPAVGPTGRLAAFLADGKVHLFDSVGNHIGAVPELPTAPGEQYFVRAVRWVVDSLSVTVGSVVHVLNPNLTSARQISLGFTTRGAPGLQLIPHSKTNITYARVNAIYPGGTLLVDEVLPAILPASARRDSMSSLALVVTDAGEYRSTMGWSYDPMGDCGLPALPLVPRPFCKLPVAAFAPNGSLLVNVRRTEPAGETKDSVGVRIIAVGPDGDTLFTRSIRLKTVPLTQAEIDSALALMRKNVAGEGNAKLSERATKMLQEVQQTMPTNHPPLLGLLPGNDGSVWLRMPSSQKDGQWLILGRTGAVLGSVTVPLGVTLKLVTSESAWGVVEQAKGPPDLIRFVVR